MLVAVMSDYFRHRFGFAVFSICIAITGFSILISVHNNTKLQYAALFLCTMGVYSAMPIVVCWFNMNLGKNFPIYLAIGKRRSQTCSVVECKLTKLFADIGGHHRRSVGSAWQIGFGNTGGIIATFAFIATDAPYFITGYSICLAFACLSILSCVVYGLACWHQNRQRERAPVDVGLTEWEQTELGDMRQDYRYLI